MIADVADMADVVRHVVQHLGRHRAYVGQHIVQCEGTFNMTMTTVRTREYVDVEWLCYVVVGCT